MATPADIPAWLWLAMAAVAGWLASEVWPFVRDETHASRRAARQHAAEREERIAAALERIAETDRRVMAAIERIDIALDTLTRGAIVTTMRIDEIHRHLRIDRRTPTDQQTLAKLLNEQLDALERGSASSK